MPLCDIYLELFNILLPKNSVLTFLRHVSSRFAAMSTRT